MVIGTGESETIDFFDTLMLHGSLNPPIAQDLSFWHKYRFIDSNFHDYLDMFDNASSAIYKQVIEDVNSNEHIYMSMTGEAAPIAMLTEMFWRKNPLNEDKEEPVQTLANELYNINPKMKFIFLLREPATHIYWHFNNAPYGRDFKSPEEFHRRINNSIEWWNACINVKRHPERTCVYGSPPDMEEFENREDNAWWPKSENFAGAMRDGLYWFYITEFLKVFPRENFLFIRADDYLADQRRVLNEKVFPFLGISAFTGTFKISKAAELLRVDADTDFKPMLYETQRLLQKFYTPFNDRLAQLLQDDKFTWKDITSPKYLPNVKCCG